MGGQGGGGGIGDEGSLAGTVTGSLKSLSVSIGGMVVGGQVIVAGTVAGPGGASGDGGAVDVHLNPATLISTAGAGGYAIVAQSIGGGLGGNPSLVR